MALEENDAPISTKSRTLAIDIGGTGLKASVLDGTGKMRQFAETVCLEGAYCGCSHVAFGGCPRGEFSYWREIWLSRR